MKRVSIIFCLVIVIVLACGSDNYQAIEKDSEQYLFFKGLSETIPMLDPDNNVTFITTNQFDLTTQNFLFYLYQEMFKESGGRLSNYKVLTQSRLEKFIRDVALNQAQRRMILIDAKEHKIEVSPDSVEAIMQRLYALKDGEENFIEEELKPRNITLEFIKADAKENLIIQKYFEDVVFGKIPCDENEVRKIYNQDTKATVRHIFLITKGKSARQKKQIHQKMESILEQANSGADFAGLAQKYSEDISSKNQGGLMENFKRGTYIPEIDKAAFSLPIDAISDIIESKIGLHILKIVERKGDPRPYELAKKAIIAKLTAGQRREADAKFSKELEEKYDLKVIQNPGDDNDS